MTNQEIFNKVCEHLMKQGCKSLDSNGNCAYRGDNGTMCAVGCLIPDEMYDPDIEGVCIGANKNALSWDVSAERIDKMIKINDLFNPENMLTLRKLQKIHDNCPVETWKHKLREHAENWNLEAPECICLN